MDSLLIDFVQQTFKRTDPDEVAAMIEKETDLNKAGILSHRLAQLRAPMANPNA